MIENEEKRRKLRGRLPRRAGGMAFSRGRAAMGAASYRRSSRRRRKKPAMLVPSELLEHLAAERGMSEIIRMGGLELRFFQTKEDTGGSLDLFEMTVQPNARVPAPHYH